MKKIRTKDDSLVFYSEEYGETYKSVSGALEEAQKKFIEVCCLRDGISILDIGFGLGYNLGMALQYCKKLRIVSLEKNTILFDAVQNLEVPEFFRKSYDIVKKLASNLEYKDKDYDLKIIVGDARQSVKKLNEKFDAVFLDPFSPKKNPELWTLKFFREIYSLMNNNGILATYSCAGQIRRNLISAGFFVKDGPRVGRRAPSTIATKSQAEKP